MCVLCFIVYLFLCTSLQSSKHTPHEVMFSQKAVLPVDFNSQESYDPEEASKACDEAPLPDPADIEAHQSEVNVMVKETIERRPKQNRKSSMTGSILVRVKQKGGFDSVELEDGFVAVEP